MIAARLLSVIAVAGATLALAGTARADLYWSNFNTNAIAHASQDGSTVNQSFISGASSPVGTAVAGNYIYWANPGTNSIGRANLDGSGANPSFITGASHPLGVAVDGQYVYWTNLGVNSGGRGVPSGTIGRASLDGSNPNQTFIVMPLDANGYGAAVAGIAVTSSYIYWGDDNQGTVGRANLDGSGVDPGFFTAATGYDLNGAMYGVAVDSGHIYWTEGNAGDIGRANLDGSGVNESFITGGSFPYGVAVDNTKIYWTNYDAGIGSASLDGTGVNQSFITGTSTPTGIVDTGGSPTVSIANASAVEPMTGDNGTLTFPVTLSSAQTTPVTVDFTTADGTATAGHDYDATSGTITIPAGATTASIPVTLHNVGREGDKTLTTTLSSPSAGVELGQATATGTIHGLGPFGITVTWLQNGKPVSVPGSNGTTVPSTLRLADADSGEVPQDLTADVTITNDSDTTQTNVSLNGTPAFSYHDPTQALQALPVGVTSGPLDAAGAPLGTIPDLDPGEYVDVDYTVHVTNNGVFDFSPQVLSSDAGTTDTQVSNGVGTLTVLPTALLWLSLHRLSSIDMTHGLVRAGTPVLVSGTLTNRSLTQTIRVAPLIPTAESGNVGGGRLVDEGNVVSSLLLDGVQLPFFGKVKPGQTITLTGRLDTAPVPSTRASVTYAPQGTAINADGSETALTASQIGLGSGSSPITISLDTTDPVLPPTTLDSTVDSFTDGAVQGAGEWALADLRGGLSLLEHPIDGAAGAVTGFAKVVVHTPGDVLSAAYILGEADVYSTAYLALSPAQRQAFAAQIIADFDASTVKADNKAVADAIQEGLQDFDDAATKGDYNKLAGLAGNGLSTGAGVVADAVLTDIFFQKLALGLNTAAETGKGFIQGQLADQMVLADKLRDASLAGKVFKTVEGIKPGQNLLIDGANALVNAWGLTPTQIVALQKFCAENKLIIAIRSRSARAARLIERGLAVGKNEVLKLKGVNELDTKYLGYEAPDLNKLVLAEPLPFSDVVANLKRYGADKQTRALVFERYDLRLAEWDSPDVRGVMDKANAAGKIDWGFNGTDNGAPAADRLAQRRFSLYDLKKTFPDSTLKRVYQEVLVGDKPGLAGRLVSVTQDVDVAAILSHNSEILTAALRTKVYEYLSNTLGIEHPETVSWIKDGEILFGAKNKELARLVYGGGEALAVFGPDSSVRAGFLNPALTIYNSATQGGRIFFQGGYNNPYAATISQITVNLKKFF